MERLCVQTIRSILLLQRNFTVARESGRDTFRRPVLRHAKCLHLAHRDESDDARRFAAHTGDVLQRNMHQQAHSDAVEAYPGDNGKVPPPTTEEANELSGDIEKTIDTPTVANAQRPSAKYEPLILQNDERTEIRKVPTGASRVGYFETSGLPSDSDFIRQTYRLLPTPDDYPNAPKSLFAEGLNLDQFFGNVKPSYILSAVFSKVKERAVLQSGVEWHTCLVKLTGEKNFCYFARGRGWTKVRVFGFNFFKISHSCSKARGKTGGFIAFDLKTPPCRCPL